VPVSVLSGIGLCQAQAAAAGAEATKAMEASAGRSQYIRPDLLRATPDPGAHAVAVWVDALAASAPK